MKEVIEHAEGHRVLVASVASESGDSSFTTYYCEDPTCDWCVTEHIGEGCKDFVKDREDYLTLESCYDKLQSTRRRAKPGDPGQGDFFTDRRC